MAERYYVDLRSGCIAVRDRERTIPDEHGLRVNSYGVVWYRQDRLVSPGLCSVCKRPLDGVWTVNTELVEAANELCRMLNDLEKRFAARTAGGQ